VLEFGGLRFQPVTRELAGGPGEPVRLTEKEAAILAYLHGAADRSVPRDELLAQVLGYSDETATHTLETHIYRLRRKFAAVAADGPTVVSEAGGYRLAVPA
jgi:DNA-binding response OmpR family regulator